LVQALHFKLHPHLLCKARLLKKMRCCLAREKQALTSQFVESLGKGRELHPNRLGLRSSDCSQLPGPGGGWGQAPMAAAQRP